MNGNSNAMPGSDDYVPNATDKLLWWLATAEKELIWNCVVDRNRYRIVGCSVLATAAFATLAWSYFFSTAVSNPLVYFPLGLFMGFIIVTIDRTLIKGINTANKNKVGPFLFRVLLALTIGVFMAQPAILYLFDKEVKLQSSLDNEARKQQQLKAVEALFLDKKYELAGERNHLETQLIDQQKIVDEARKSFLSETDGSGGSGKIGISTIALTKKAEFNKQELTLQQLQLAIKPQLDSLQRQLSGIADTIKSKQLQFEQLLNDGFLTRIQALNNLVKSNDALAFRYYLIVAILMLIELMPVIAKAMLPLGAYDEKVKLQEQLEKDLWKNNLDRESALNTYYNDLTLQDSKETVDHFFVDNRIRKQDKMNDFGETWRKDKHQTFDGLWKRMKQDMFSKWEN